MTKKKIIKIAKFAAAALLVLAAAALPVLAWDDYYVRQKYADLENEYLSKVQYFDGFYLDRMEYRVVPRMNSDGTVTVRDISRMELDGTVTELACGKVDGKGAYDSSAPFVYHPPLERLRPRNGRSDMYARPNP